MSKNLISKLLKLINEGRKKDKIEAYEELIIDEIEEYAKESSFYELPTKEILKIIGKSSIEEAELLCDIISRMCSYKGEESPLLLNVIKVEEATFEECIKIISKFKKCPLCKRINELFQENINLPERDYQHEIEELKKENIKLKNETEKKKPSDFIIFLKQLKKEN